MLVWSRSARGTEKDDKKMKREEGGWKAEIFWGRKDEP